MGETVHKVARPTGMPRRQALFPSLQSVGKQGELTSRKKAVEAMLPGLQGIMSSCQEFWTTFWYSGNNSMAEAGFTIDSPPTHTQIPESCLEVAGMMTSFLW